VSENTLLLHCCRTAVTLLSHCSYPPKRRSRGWFFFSFCSSYKWCCSGVTVVLQWCYRGVTVVLQWCYLDVKVVLQWCYSTYLREIRVLPIRRGVTVLVLWCDIWCYSGVTVVLKWRHNGVTVVLQWCYSGVTVYLVEVGVLEGVLCLLQCNTSVTQCTTQL
jgi:hypothetical protein